jgi:dihydroorotate dehydrogenase (fumarate)
MHSTALETTYLGLPLRSPLVASASPVTGDLDSLLAVEAAGAGAVVLPSVFEEQLALDPQLWARADAWNQHARRPHGVDLDDYNAGSAAYLRLVEQARQRLTIPVVASLNCARPVAWPDFARVLVAAGADAIELNVGILSADPACSAQDVEDAYVEAVGSIVEAAAVPVAVKLPPFLTAPANLARRLHAVGVGGLVLFGRMHEPDIDLARRETVSRLARSSPAELGLRLRWLALLRNGVPLSLAATGGVWSGADAAKAILAGADVVMVASVLLARGVDALAQLEAELVEALATAWAGSVAEARGLLALAGDAPQDADRSAYLRAFVDTATAS